VRRKALLFGFLAAAGLGLYVWAALSAPVVWNSDSALDLKWAKTSPLRAAAAGQPHPAKPGYLLFLAAAVHAFPSLGEQRSVVVAQSLLVWLSIVATAAHVFRRRGGFAGLALLALLLAFLRLRDSTSAVLSDAAAAALFLPIAVFCLDPPRARAAFAALGIAATLLFWVRPNVGFAAFVLGAILLWRTEARRGAAILVLSLALPMVSVWLLTRPDSQTGRLLGLDAPVLMGSAPYYWMPAIGGFSGGASTDRLQRAAQNWKRFLSRADFDTRRELGWRTAHGLLGGELYDGRWSPTYRRFDALSREASPFLVLAAIGVFAAAFAVRALPIREKAAGLLLIALLVGHDLLFGSHPRYLLPFIPVLFLLSVAQLSAWRADLSRAAAVAAGVFAALLAWVAHCPGVTDWEWGLIERSGVEIRQTIPRHALPSQGPATLHVRVAPLVMPSNAHVEIFGPGDELLFTSRQDPARENPFVSLPLPESLLRANRAGDVTLNVRSVGDYDPVHFLIFPLVPPPWSAPASRQGSAELSPETGIASGSLDWWAHAGSP
jgi:hypothetical protein